MWRCPRCGRTYERTNQWHGCGSGTPEDHLEGKPESLRVIYRHLEEGLRKEGVRIDAAKTAINLWKGRNFATVYVQKRAVKVEFLSRIPIRDARIAGQHKVKEGLFFNMLKLTRKEEVDEKLLGWLKGID